jgi:hypothetical protein
VADIQRLSGDDEFFSAAVGGGRSVCQAVLMSSMMLLIPSFVLFGTNGRRISGAKRGENN